MMQAVRGIEDAGRHDMQFEFSLGVYNRMAGVIAAGETYDGIRLLRQKVYYFAFALIAPLGANNCYN